MDDIILTDFFTTVRSKDRSYWIVIPRRGFSEAFPKFSESVHAVTDDFGNLVEVQ